MAARDPRLEHYIELFNRGEYWESHEALEPLWIETDGARKELYRGLIMAAAAMVHKTRHGNHGIRVLFGKAKRRLRPFCPTADGIDLLRFLFDLEHHLFRRGPVPKVIDAAEPTP